VEIIVAIIAATVATIDMIGMPIETRVKTGIETGIAMTTETRATHSETSKL
jgi:hypothetical protein